MERTKSRFFGKGRLRLSLNKLSYIEDFRGLSV
jgi:hypothetical protein